MALTYFVAPLRCARCGRFMQESRSGSVVRRAGVVVEDERAALAPIYIEVWA